MPAQVTMMPITKTAAPWVATVVHQVRAALDARVCQEEDQAEVLKKQACGARDVPHNGPRRPKWPRSRATISWTAGNSQRNAHSVAQAEG